MESLCCRMVQDGTAAEEDCAYIILYWWNLFAVGWCRTGQLQKRIVLILYNVGGISLLQDGAGRDSCRRGLCWYCIILMESLCCRIGAGRDSCRTGMCLYYIGIYNGISLLQDRCRMRQLQRGLCLYHITLMECYCAGHQRAQTLVAEMKSA